MSGRDGSSPAWVDGPARPPAGSRTHSLRQHPGKQHRDPSVAIVKKKKKKSKKVVKHPDPDPQNLGLGKGPPATSLAAAETSIDGQSSEARDQRNVPATRYQAGDSEEFRNVWDADR